VGLGLSLAGMVAALAFGVGVTRLPFGAPLVMLILGGMCLGLAALSAWRVVEPLVGKDTPRTEAARVPARLRDLEREKQAVLKAIKEIDLDHQMRKISDDDHRELTQRYRSRALRLIAELEAGGDYRTLIEQELKSRIAAARTARASSMDARGGSS
jgi:hypothetical protein